MSDTPRTDAVEKHAYQFKDDWTPACESKFVRQLERELNTANQRVTEREEYVTELESRLRALWDKYDGDRKHYMERIKRLEEAGDDVVEESCIYQRRKDWRKAKEAKP